MTALMISLTVSMVLCVYFARLMAVRRRRTTATGWMLAAAVLGPVALAVLAVLPRRRASLEFASDDGNRS